MSGAKRAILDRAVTNHEVALTRFHQVELLQGCRDEEEWALLHGYLEGQEYVELSTGGWTEAARAYFELRRQGTTVRSVIDCCIAQATLESDALLMHRDRDFESIARVRPLRQIWLDWSAAPAG